VTAKAQLLSSSVVRLLLAGIVLAVLVAGCGGGGSSSDGSSSSSGESAAAAGGTENAGDEETDADEAAEEGAATEAGTGEPGVVEAEWEKPHGEENVAGYELLKASETRSLAKSLATAFELPNPLLIKGVNGFGGGPFYNPEDNSITLPYEFPAVVFGVITQSNPEGTPTEWGEAAGAVNSFILAHEFAHALIHNFELPVLGREEDAADGIATVVLLKAEEGGLYAIDAAEFWEAFSGRQDPPDLAEYADNHSFDRQRADNILCWVAGSDEPVLEAFLENEILPEDRLAACPSEWALLRQSAEQVLDPHLVNGANLAPAE
jgi:Putative metallopeptidase